MANQKSRIQRSKKHPIGYSIHKIELLESKIYDYNDSLNIHEDKLRYKATFSFHQDEGINAIDVEFYYQFFFEETKLYEIKTKNTFAIEPNSLPHLEDFLIHKRFLINITKLTIDHSRGIQSQLIKDSYLSQFYLPFMDEKKIEQILPHSNEQ